MRFYADAEDILSHLPRRGIPMVLREVEEGVFKPFAFPTMQHKVQRLRVKLKLPSHFTLDACRHGGMTELEEAELTDGQGRALSTHKTQASYEGYAKRTAKRMLSATMKRLVLLRPSRTKRRQTFQMSPWKAFQMRKLPNPLSF